MKSRWMLVLALLLPIAGLAAGIVRNEAALASAESWTIPIEGFDPRDLLRGHYIQFRYKWQVEGDESLCHGGNCYLCLEQDGETVRAVVVPRQEAPACPSRVDPEASNIGRGFTSRIFVSEASAPRLEQELRETPMVIIAQLRRDGVLVNERILPAAQ